MRSIRLAVLPGDGIGPEVIEAALAVLAPVAERRQLSVEVARLSPRSDAGEPRLGTAVVETLRGCDGILKGPAGDPNVRVESGTEAALMGGVLRPALDTYANVRRIRAWPNVEVHCAGDVRSLDYVIVRENVEGLYASRAGGARSFHGAADVLLATRAGSERIARYAFGLAERRAATRDHPPRVTCVDKANVLPSHAYMRGIVTEVATEYPMVELDLLYADAAGQALVLDPGRFDVLLMENFLGDVLSEVAAATVGGISLQPSGNIGDEAAYFEPAHGSAPDLAGRDVANPIGQILSMAMLLEHIGEPEAAADVEAGVRRALGERRVTLDRLGRPSTGTRETAAMIALMAVGET